MHRCALCGTRFGDEESRGGCGSCPLHPSGCGLVRCPNCGYEWPTESKVLGFFGRLARRLVGRK
jgi:hypothetical protein